MAILLRILGVLWCIAGLLVTVAAAAGAVLESDGDAPCAMGAFLGAGVMLAPGWMTGSAFFLLPGWIRKQLGQTRSDTFA